MVKILFASDLHGNMYGYEHVFRIARERGIDTIVLGGDLAPKRLALKLKDFDRNDDRFDEEPDLVEGIVIPYEMLDQSRDANTYTEGLRAVKKLNERQKPEDLARSLERNGYIIHPVGNAFYNFEGMLDDNLTIDELMRFFSIQGEIKRLAHPINLTESQREISLDTLINELRERENNLTEVTRDNMARRWRSGVTLGKGSDAPSFDDLALSKNIPLYFALGSKLPELREQQEKVLGGLDTSDEEVRKRFERAIRSPANEVDLAIQLMNRAYNTTFIDQLALSTPINQLKEDNSLDRNPSVYIGGQRRFLGRLRDLIEEHKAVNPQSRVYAILGNDDMAELDADMRALHDGRVLTYLNTGSVETEEGITIAGYPFVSSSQGRFYAGWEKDEGEIREDLEKIKSGMEDRGRRVSDSLFVIHTPAYGGDLDVNYRDEHVGSPAVRDFIREHQPRVVLSGHVHESFKKTGKVMEMERGTPCYNPGAHFGRDKCTAVILDTDRPDVFERIYEVDVK